METEQVYKGEILTFIRRTIYTGGDVNSYVGRNICLWRNNTFLKNCDKEELFWKRK